MASGAVAGPFEDGFAAVQRGDYATALKLWAPLAERGNVGAEMNLGLMYEQGHGVPKDPTEAEKWYRRAAEQGITKPSPPPQAVTPLADADTLAEADAAHGRGDYMTAIRLYRPLADGGNANAQNAVGLLDNEGYGVPVDYVEAMTWFRLAADQGYAQAQANVDAMYENGQSVQADDAAAYMWFSLAAAGAQDDYLRVSFIRVRDAVAVLMSPEQIAEAQRVAREWKPTPAQ